jgi:hypothetical protein
MQVHYGNNDYHLPADLVDQSIRKTTGSATARTLRDRCPCLWILRDARESSLHFSGEFVAKSFALLVVVGYSLGEFSFGWVKEFDSHPRAC